MPDNSKPGQAQAEGRPTIRVTRAGHRERRLAHARIINQTPAHGPPRSPIQWRRRQCDVDGDDL
jgi:hypothetical protein